MVFHPLAFGLCSLFLFAMKFSSFVSNNNNNNNNNNNIQILQKRKGPCRKRGFT